MSLALLLEKYDVSTEEGLQKALSEIEKEESEVNSALCGALSRATSLDARVRSAGQAHSQLGAMQNDARSAQRMVERTAELARDVSAKVRQLDLARSRVAECQRRVHDLIDLQLCSAGVEAAIKAHDYETGAGHVARFLSMDPGSVAAARARGDLGAPDPRDAMAAAAATLRQHLVAKFEEAARKEDSANVERLFKLFPQIGKAEEGVDLLAKYLAAQAEAAIRRASVVAGATAGADGCVHADALTRVLEAGGAAVERARALARTHAPGLLPRAITYIQPHVCSGARRVCASLFTSLRGTTDPRRPFASPLQAEPALTELALAHSRVQLYFTFLRRKTELDASTLDEKAKQASLEAVENIITGCDLQRTAQDLLAQYLNLERYFLEESVNKALKMAAPQAGATSSSLVDDVFFIARKVIRRSLSTGSVDGLCCVLNEAGAALEREAAAALRRWLRSPPDRPLQLPLPGGQGPDDALARRLNRDVDAHRQLFLAHMNEAEAGAEWAERLAAEAVQGADTLLRAAGGRAREKLLSCAAGLGGAAAAFRAAHDLGASGVKAALKPAVKAWAERLADPTTPDDDLEDDADLLPAALDAFADCARTQLSSKAADGLLVALIADIAARAEECMLREEYEREAGLCVERRARRLAAWAGGAAGGARERCARLTQAAALLALERVEHAPDALRPAARLSPADARALLARRTDFKIEDIKRLKL